MLKRAFLIICVFFNLLDLNAIAKPFKDSSEVKIRLNQIGFYPDAPKIAIITTHLKGQHFVIQNSKKKTVFNGTFKRSVDADFAGKYTLIADFSELNQPGEYRIFVPGDNLYSYPFMIARSVHRELAKASIKAFYYMRASIPLEKKYAGKWERAEGHPDDKVLIHATAAGPERPEGTLINSPGGWYDAGDYNKYIVNSGISTYTLMSLYEDFPEYMGSVKLNIPESGNQVPDVLNEVLWNLRWMLTMQDSNDGGVYHKLTNAVFDGMVMPNKATSPRYVVFKTTAATLDFAAVMAQASRIFRQFPGKLPGLADSCLDASKRAWKWALINPRVIYNKEVLKQTSSSIATGDYGDKDVSDEFIWAASELFVTTKNNAYLKAINITPDDKMPLPSWNQVRLLGYYSIFRHRGSLGANGSKYVPQLKAHFMAYIDNLIKDADKTSFKSVMYKDKVNFVWGSNSIAANQGIALIQAYQLSHDKKYLKYALANLDYILGRNGTGYSYVTGYGSKTPMHPLHRPSIADGIVEPVPGLLAGGANPGMQDHIMLPSLVPDEAYIDKDQAYAVNEVAINWNAPLAYLANALEVLQGYINN